MITSIQAFPVKVPRDLAGATGTAGSPTSLSHTANAYRWSKSYPALYSTRFESALVRIQTDAGLIGWGEAQAPLAPEVVCTIIRCLLGPVLAETEFLGTRSEIENLWWQMYSTMRVRGQTGGFMLDAISGIDLALWDLAGQIQGKPVCDLIAKKSTKSTVPAYVSGITGETSEARIQAATKHFAAGFGTFKLFLNTSTEEILKTFDDLQAALPSTVRIGIDALWHLNPETAVQFGQSLDERHALWLECPFVPEDVKSHCELARAIRTPIAIGESYRTHFELVPFFEERILGIVQPDLGRCGITEALTIARLAADRNIAVVPHVSIAFGPQIAAAIHLAAALPNCSLLEFNPQVLEIANRYLAEPIAVRNGCYVVPQSIGLGGRISGISVVRQDSGPL